MRILPADFQKHGFHYRLVARAGDVAVYQKFADDWQHRHHFEVFRIQQHEGRTIAGRQIPAAEFLPSSEQWGTLGWSFIVRDAALQKFAKLSDPAMEPPGFTSTKRARNDFDAPDRSTQRPTAQNAPQSQTSTSRHERRLAVGR